MFRSKNVKRVISLVVTMVLVICASLQVFALYDKKSGMAGSTSVVADAGSNGNNYYVAVTASDYIDGRMEGVAGYYQDNEYDSNEIYSGFDQRTYAETSGRCPTSVLYVNCNIRVWSDNGYWGEYLEAH